MGLTSATNLPPVLIQSFAPTVRGLKDPDVNRIMPLASLQYPRAAPLRVYVLGIRDEGVWVASFTEEPLSPPVD